MGVPVIAYAATAVPATMDGGGILVHEQGPAARRRPDQRGRRRPRRWRIASSTGRTPRSSGSRPRTSRGTLLRLRRRGAGGAAARASAGRLRLLGSGRPGRAARRDSSVPAGGVSGASAEPGTGREPSRNDGPTPAVPTIMIVNQWVPAAHKGDAIGDSARRVRGLLREMGHQSDLFALTIDDDLRGDVIPLTDPAATRGDLTIFHFALPSPMTDAFARLPRGRVLQYHNVTPAHFFAALRRRRSSVWRRSAARSWRRWSASTDMALGDSEYNRQELEALGFTNTGVFPIAVDTRPHHRRAAAAGARGRARSRTAGSTSCSSAASSPTRRSRITSSWPSTTSATSTSSTASSSSAGPTRCRATTT